MSSCVRVCVLRAMLLAVLCVVAASSRANAQISVTLATPNSATPGTINLDVTVNGKGFKSGAKAQWFVTGTTNPGGVTVNSTKFVSSTALTANITVSDTAVLANFDVQVMNTDGRTGKGTELFAVVANGSKTSSCQTLPALNPTANSCSTNGAGCLDTSFGTAGIVPLGGVSTTDLAIYSGVILGVATGSSSNTVAAFNSDGSSDTSFGGGSGTAPVPSGGVGPDGSPIAVLSDGSTIVLSASSLTKLTPAGLRDPNFGTNGTVTLATSGEGLAVQSNDYILVAGGVTTNGKSQSWHIGRFNPASGKLDPTFGSSGYVTFSPGVASNAHAIATQHINGEEAVVVAGDPYTVARFHANGSLDTSFGTSSGMTKAVFYGRSEWVSDIAVDYANRLVVGGQAQSVPNTCGIQYQWTILRLTPTGLPDTAFGQTTNPNGLGQGRVAINFANGNDRIHRVAIDPDGLNGLVVAGGFSYDPSSAITRGVVVRLLEDGSLDASFGSSGAAMTSPGHVRSITTQSDGKIVVGDDAAGLLRYWNVVH